MTLYGNAQGSGCAYAAWDLLIQNNFYILLLLVPFYMFIRSSLQTTAPVHTHF